MRDSPHMAGFEPVTSLIILMRVLEFFFCSADSLFTKEATLAFVFADFKTAFAMEPL
jgi:hypothetical protein